MRGLFKTRRPPLVQQQQQQVELPSPLHIPEILERIVSFIDSPIDALATLLVCREWHRIARHLFIREVVVDYRQEQQQGLISSTFSSMASTAALEKLPIASRLCWYDGHGIYYTERCIMDAVEPRRWQALVDALKKSDKLYQRQRKQQQQPKLLLEDVFPLRQLKISAGPGLDWFSTLLPFLSSLTRLDLQWGGVKASISLLEVFRSCPLLETVSLTARGFVRISGLESIPAGAPLPLRSLSLRRADLLQEDLENLLSATPKLEVLRLVDMRTNKDASTGYSLSRLVQSLHNSSIQLSTFHVHPTVLPNRVEERYFDSALSDVMYELDPTLTGWSFWGGDLTDKILSNLNDLTNVVTTLELHNINTETTGSNCRLHKYLCKSPHLLHLRAPQTAIMVEAFDLHSRSHLVHKGYLPVDEKDKDKEKKVRDWNRFKTTCDHGQTQVWMCRKLRTLHFSIYSGTEPEFASPARSRIVFGYLSRICPNLQDLQISIPPQHGGSGGVTHPALDLRLEGGLCLLARMRQLRILRIGSFDSKLIAQPKDLSWMLGEAIQKDKEKMQQRALRRATVEGWEDWLKTEKADDAHGRNAIMCKRWRAETIPGDHVELRLREDLKTMGLLLDVKLMLDEMDCPGDNGIEYHCWPGLRQISLNSAKESTRSPEKEFQRLFPSRFDFIRLSR